MPNGSGRHSYQFLLIGLFVDVGHPLAELLFSELLLEVLCVDLFGGQHIGVIANDSDLAVSDYAVIVDELVSLVDGCVLDQQVRFESETETAEPSLQKRVWLTRS